MNPEQLLHEYAAIREPLTEVRNTLLEWLRSVTREVGVADPRLSGRVKEAGSLLVKALARELGPSPWPNPIEDATDKVGLRVDVVYDSDVDLLVDRIRSERVMFDGASARVDDKRQTLNPEQLGYEGVHIDLVPNTLPRGLRPEVAKCEIQIRTNAQAAWAMAAHELVYKPPVTPPKEQQRRIYRLTALLELVDEEIAAARAAMMRDDGYPLAIVTRALEQAWYQLVGVPFDRGLTSMIIQAVSPMEDAAGAHALARALETFLDDKRPKLSGIYATLDEALARPILLRQPESILVFYLLETAPLGLQDKWATASLDHTHLDDLASLWGAGLPVPN